MKIIRFLGGVNFAIILIALAAVMVAIGTFLESKTTSHQVASELIYESIFFKLLLIGFFINILVSALRRIPFQKKHIPFLITHFGLLMIISGTFIKTIKGVQGNMVIVEGTSNAKLQIPMTMALSTLDRKGNLVSYPFQKGNKLPKNSSLTLLEFSPHSEEKYYSWINRDKAYFHNSIFKAYHWQPGSPLPTDNPLALNTNFFDEAIEQLLLDGLQLDFSETLSGKKIGTFTLKELVLEKKEVENYKVQVFLNKYTLNVLYENKEVKGELLVELSGPQALLNQPKMAYLGKAPITIDISSTIPLTFLQNEKLDSIVIIPDQHGRLYEQHFPANGLKSYIAYNDGFDGYTVQAEYTKNALSRKQMEKAFCQECMKSFSLDSLYFLPHLKLFKEAIPNFSAFFISFLDNWNQNGGWLYPDNNALPFELLSVFRSLDWSLLKPEELKSCLWISYFFQEFDAKILAGDSFLAILKEKKWPLLPSLELLENDEERLTFFTRQLFAMGNDLPWIPFSQKPETLARLFSAILRMYGIHFSHIPFSLDTSHKTYFEAPLFKKSKPLPALSKTENNIPRVLLKAENGEKIAMTFNSLKWPIQNGDFLLSFHPQTFELPYKVRLHKAKQINYPDTEQAFGYEADLTFTNKEGYEKRSIISMNQVYETWDGFRFYLSGISKTSSGAHLIQLIVNRDPAKYWLTYPGGCLVALGILLLFSRKK